MWTRLLALPGDSPFWNQDLDAVLSVLKSTLSLTGKKGRLIAISGGMLKTSIHSVCTPQ
jgi:hypothetical protein